MNQRFWKICMAFVLIIGTVGCGVDNTPNQTKVQQDEQDIRNFTEENHRNGLHREPVRHTDEGVPFRDSENWDLDTYQSHFQSHPLHKRNGLNQQINIYGNAKTPKNVILMIGDGMGIGQLEIARLFEHGKDGRLFMQGLPHVALSQTYSANNFVTDSAAAGTALATGVKTNNESIGVNAEGKEVDSILDLFQQAGKKVGIVSTNTVTDATPAAFAASVANRWTGQEEVARQILNRKIDVVLGGGARYFSPKKQNGVDLVEKYRDEGYTVVNTRDQLLNATGERLLGLFHNSYMNYVIDRDDMNSAEPNLVDMTKKTIGVLSKGDQGFFAMIEGARIDHAAHAADFTSIWKETVEFDQAVEHAVNWAKQEGNTLVVVLADHETLGISAAEPMNIEALKNMPVTPEFMAGKLQINEANQTYDPESVKNVFRTYANIDLTDDEVAQFNERVKDTEGKVYASYRVGWEIGSIIASHYNASAMDTAIRSISKTGGHTGNMVPVFAYGIGAESFEGVLDNTEIPRLIARISGLNMDQIKVYIGNDKIRFPVSPILSGGRTLVPIREISESLGAKVDWNGQTRTATITKGDLTITLVIGQNVAKKNNESIQLDVPAQIIQNKTFVPLRFVSEAFGGEVNWDANTKTIDITGIEVEKPAS